jgi:hypothetical protein
MPNFNKYRVRCTICGWAGYRHARDCECYLENVLYCTPDSPGQGCPSWITYPCPKGHLRVGKGYGPAKKWLWRESDSAVVVVKGKYPHK